VSSCAGRKDSLLSGGATVLTKAEMPLAASGRELGVVNSVVYAGGRKVADVAIEEAGEWSRRPGHVVWIGLKQFPAYLNRWDSQQARNEGVFAH
jgi:hypothetical protein